MQCRLATLPDVRGLKNAELVRNGRNRDVVLWFITAAANMWIGVSRAGYSFQEELPIFLLIFLLPCAVAVLVKWKLL
jgi:hypothetical protein